MYKENTLQSRRFFFFFFKRDPKVSQKSKLITASAKFPCFASYKEYNRTFFIEKANANHLTVKFTTEVSAIETTFLDTTVYKGERFEKKESLMYVHILSLLKHFSAHT